jgi:hypothetical protein
MSLRSVALKVAFLGLLSLVLANPHGDEEAGHGMNMTPTINVEYSESFDVPSYFNHTEYRFWIWSHVATMIISWVLILPVGELKVSLQ